MGVSIERATHDTERAPAAPAGLREFLLPAASSTSRAALAGRALLYFVLLVWGLRLTASPVESNAVGRSVLHLVNLPFHEAGHVVFSPFGGFLHSLGGTLGQLLIPLICAGTLLLRTRDPFGAAVGLWWFGENFLDIAPYINDARALELPLLGGIDGASAPYGFHDWNYLLTESGLLFRDHELARACHLMGCVIMVFALVWAAALLYRAGRGLEEHPLRSAPRVSG